MEMMQIDATVLAEPVTSSERVSVQAERDRLADPCAGCEHRAGCVVPCRSHRMYVLHGHGWREKKNLHK